MSRSLSWAVPHRLIALAYIISLLLSTCNGKYLEKKTFNCLQFTLWNICLKYIHVGYTWQVQDCVLFPTD